ncbi:MAG: aspartate/tyrosine/aromatic aminotransferase [Alphaproteobacteria bacterium]|nr:aspartate/tyrosine/aromatic aminotransferase [Alphaproteobacteria bacterium]MBV9062827.1 aspartate/tyrosine/aromatic aminotransferase [Alphaproteobacteria bacterium]
MFEELKPRAPDPLLDTIRQFRGDPRPGKLDLGVGVFQDEQGRTPVLRSVKQAEALLLETQQTKTYLGAEGDVEFSRALGTAVLGHVFGDGRVIGLQAPGGTGALRLAADLIRVANPNAQIWLGLPTWPNHQPIFSAVGIPLRDYRHFDPGTQAICFDELRAAMKSATRGDVFVLHSSCHNPTGADFTIEQWQEIARTLNEYGLIPLLDTAYQGFARGLDEDMAGARHVFGNCPEAILTVSCSKNFGLYRERTGALFVRAADTAKADAVRTNLMGIARTNYSMPPDHGAAIVRTILQDARLRAEWEREVGEMRGKLNGVRQKLSGLRINSLDLSPLAKQNGMFATLPLGKLQIERLKEERGIYMAPSGRINIAGLMATDIDAFAAALRSVLIDAAA